MSIPEIPISKDGLHLPGEPLSGLDTEVLTQLAGLDPDGSRGLLPRLLTLYLSSLTDLIRQLDAARRPVDPAALGWVAHSLKSSSASMGALRLSVLCRANSYCERAESTACPPCSMRWWPRPRWSRPPCVSGLAANSAGLR